MCGIFACIDSEGADVSFLALQGLRRLVYRGYDSYGFAGTDGSTLHRVRSLDSIEDAAALMPAGAVIGHTRWATHGGVSLDNCHPRMAASGAFAVCHNGVVENAAQFAADSDSDTEAIVRLLESNLSGDADRQQVLLGVLAQLEGQNSIVILFEDGELVAGRNGAPLFIARASDPMGLERYFIASDSLSLGGFASEVCELEVGQVVSLKAVTGVPEHVLSGAGFQPIVWQTLIDQSEAQSLGDYRHHMMKEVQMQWAVLPQESHLDQLSPMIDIIRDCDNVFVIGAGGAAIAASFIARMLRELGGCRALALSAVEPGDLRSLAVPGDFCLAISQSGETADTIRALALARQLGCITGAHSNVPGSSLARMADVSFLATAGPEICVLSTKSAMAQLAFGYLLAGSLNDSCHNPLGKLARLSQVLARNLALDETYPTCARGIAHRFQDQAHIYLLGEGGCRDIADMAALNIKEASYIHAESFSAGELKHGVLALIEPGSLVVLYQNPEDGGCRVHNVAAEVHARGATLIGVGGVPDPRFDLHLPLPGDVDRPLRFVFALIAGQLLAYYLALARGVNPDRPRNLAKSVTVL